MKAVLSVLVMLILWECAGDMHLVAAGALPSPSAIILQWWRDRADYPPHIWATLGPAALGFLIGNTIAVAAAVAFVLSPVLAGLMRGVNVTIFAIPPIALSPILVITLPGEWPQVALAAIGVYFPTMVMAVLGLSDIDPRPADVIRAYGGGTLAVLRLLRLRSSVPGVLAGLRVAAPAAILGGILAEFGSGARWGLGSFLLGSMGRADPARIWGIGLTATLIAACAYWACALLARRATASMTAVTIAGGKGGTASDNTPMSPVARGLLTLGSLAMPFLLWWAIPRVFGVSNVIAKSPLAIWQYLTSAPEAADSRSAIVQALGQSLPLAGAGLLLALVLALLLAVSGTVWRNLSSMLMPAALLLQTMPLVALTPLIVLLFGRGVATTLVVTALVTFFPAYITIVQGLAQVPRSSLDLLDVYGAGRLTRIFKVSLPMSLPHLCAAARLVAPAALLGVMIAEWLATGYGLGNLLNTARGELDYGMIWTVAFVAVAVSVGFYQCVRILESFVLRRMRMTAAAA